MKDRSLKIVAILSLMVGALSASIAARAEHVQGETPFFAGVPLDSLVKGAAGSSINTTQLVWGTSLSVHALSFSSAGRLTVDLTDIEWPDPLQSLDLLVTDLDGTWRKLTGSGSLLLDLSGPAKLFVAVFAKSESKHTPGMYQLRADFAPVPLPAAAWLLLSGLGGLAMFRRKAAAA